MSGGVRMHVEQSLCDVSGTWQQANNSGSKSNPQLVLYFGARGAIEAGDYFQHLKTQFPTAHLVGCSTAGEVLDVEVYDGSVVASAITFEKTRVEVASLRLKDMTHSFSVGAQLARQLASDDLSGMFILSDGIHVNGSELVRGATSVLGKEFPITGGLAGDAAQFSKTLVGCDGPAEPDQVAAVGFYGDSISIGHGSVGGWDAFGPERIITKSNSNELFELDGQPALELYKTYLGDEAANLPGSALLFPLMVREPGSAEVGLVRTVLSVDEERQSMIFAGDVPTGHKAQLMHANFERLIDGAGQAAQIANVNNQSFGHRLAILISCVGRKMVLGQRAVEEIEAVHDMVGMDALQIGFYSYGEIAPQATFKTCELHNQTMTVTLLSEI